MSVILRASKTNLFLGRSAPLRGQVRNSGSYYSQNNFEGYGDSIKHQLKNSDKTSKFWKLSFIIAGIPSVLGAMWLALKDHQHHEHQPREEYIEYPYLNVRNKPFPWGDGNHSLFHHPEKNWVPGVGYEKESH